MKNQITMSPNSTSHYLDYNQDGSIDIHDLMDHLTNKPEITDP